LVKVKGRFERIGWDAALDLLADKISSVIKTKPEAFFYYQGFGSRTALKMVNRRLFNLLGPVTTLTGTVCGGAGQGAQDLDYGERISHDFRDHLNSSTLVVWGRNPAVTSLNLVPIALSLKAQGKPVVLIDPALTESASLCSWRLAPRPGTDAQLALALARLIFTAGAEDRDFLENHAQNLAAYKALVFQEELAKRASDCGLDPADIIKLSQTLMENKPVAFVLGWGLHRWRESQVTIRSIDALAATLGSIGRVGGGVSQGFEEWRPYDWSVWGDDPRNHGRRFLMPILGEELEKANPQVTATLITAGNPATMLPDSRRVQAALSKIAFKAVAGHFLDDTALMADLFLPATTFLEEDDVVAAYGHSYICPVNQAIKPLGESRSDFDLFMALGARLGLSSYVKPRQEWLKLILAPTLKMGVSLETIQAGGAYQPDVPHVPFLDREFPTPNGRFNLIDQFVSPAVYDPERPLALLSVSPKQWLCSEISPRDRLDILPVTINASLAQNLGIEEGEEIWVISELGRIKARARLEPLARPDVAVIPRGGWGRHGLNVNVLTRAIVTTVGRGTAYHQTRVSLAKITASEKSEGLGSGENI
jgi:anaerobic selenocysteine-containing dehydrogenase